MCSSSSCSCSRVVFSAHYVSRFAALVALLVQVDRRVRRSSRSPRSPRSPSQSSRNINHRNQGLPNRRSFNSFGFVRFNVL